jgi:hypothetical protein
MTKTSFGMKTDRMGTYVYQAQDELDKNHRESADPLVRTHNFSGDRH